mmetsp:Transcript_6198/g.12223  ORF Transcript_6198/g.12223 Transcript_6198/m.12223 type:complete len:145 (-) Transcript_6198:513-947(-)
MEPSCKVELRLWDDKANSYFYATVSRQHAPFFTLGETLKELYTATHRQRGQYNDIFEAMDSKTQDQFSLEHSESNRTSRWTTTTIVTQEEKSMFSATKSQMRKTPKSWDILLQRVSSDSLKHSESQNKVAKYERGYENCVHVPR